ncbi:hypothetical protein Pan44_29090 [Caulifigura coniformis]|uniref:Acetyl xylan esterase (AXE1) n=1 Tax=Caulifigura coniformis TaxID=2527983 RepID=A0A517SFJ9_9PLAN|nr:hypothetical protein [Caulifigura coniformis]QDT54870.1 hypothetical protein Pan44_29090 [Caulifigura coniformis]
MIRPLVIAAAVLLLSTVVRGADPERIAASLREPILDREAMQRDMEKFCQSRVPLTPTPTDRDEWEAFIRKARRDTLEKVVFRGEAANWRQLPTRPEWLGEIDAGDYRIRKLRYEATPGMWVCGLLYEPKTLEGNVPVAMQVNGHDRDGKAAKYKQIRCINLVKRGILVLNLEWFNMGQLRQPEFDHYRLNQLDLCGTSGISCFYLAMSRGIDVLLAHPNADASRVTVSGLSGGGWQTIFISSLDERVTLCDPVAGYSSFRTRAVVRADLGDSEQTPTDLATTADYAVLTAMRAPRPTLLTFNDRDNCCFQSGNALPELLRAARPAFQLYGAGDKLEVHVNHVPGTHNFDRDNREALYRMIGRHFYPDAAFDPNEIECDSEIKSAEELNVELPDANAGFTTVARQLADAIPRDESLSDEILRTRLRQTLRYLPQEASAEHLSALSDGSVDVHRWKLRIGDAWTIPATEFVPEGATESALLLTDEGRAKSAGIIEKLLEKKVRVLAVDVLHIGESKLPSHDFLFGLLISAVGQRPLGVQAGQINAAAEWWSGQCGRPVRLHAVGPRSSLMAWCSAALGGKGVAGVQSEGGFASLREIIDRGLAIPDGPELFCFGLLQAMDVPQLKRLASDSGR